MTHAGLLIRLVAGGCLAAALSPVASGQVVLDPAEPAPALDGRWDVLEGEPRTALEASTAPARRAPLFVPGSALPGPVWARVEVASGSAKDARWILPFSVDEATVYVVDRGRVVDTLRTGTAVPLEDRDVPTASPPVVALDLPAGASRTLVLELRHDPLGYTFDIATRPATARAFEQEQRRETVGVGVLLGLLVSLALYNLFLFVSFRDRSYLYYVLFLAGSAAYWATAAGFVLEYVFPTSFRGRLELTFFGLTVAAVGYALFARSFLRTRDHAPVLDRVLLGTAAAWALAALAALASVVGTPRWPAVQLFAALTALVTLCTTVAAGVRAHLSGYEPARYYLLASASLVVSGALYTVVWLGWVETSWDPTGVLKLGKAGEALLFAVALSHRIRLLDRQRGEAVAAREAAEAAAATLQETDALRTDLLGSAAHDLRSPLTGVVGYAELIADEAPPGSDVGTFAGVIQKEADRMLHLIDDLLVTSALEGQALELDREPTDLGEMLGEVVASYRPRAEAKGQTIALEAEPGVVAALDRSRFRDVLDNLVSNAVKYTPNGGAVRVALEAGDVLEVRVSDTGPGLTADDRAKLFGRFQRLSAQPTGGESSTGLGLSIARDVVVLHGGRVEVESEPGHGATFVVTLPALAAVER